MVEQVPGFCGVGGEGLENVDEGKRSAQTTETEGEPAGA